MSGRAAAIAVGYSERNAAKTARRLNENPLIKGELEKSRNELVEQGKYGRDQAVKELDMRIEAASAVGQHTAVASMMRDKLRLYGLLIDKVDLRAQGSFQIVFKGVFGQPPVDVTPGELGEVDESASNG